MSKQLKLTMKDGSTQIVDGVIQIETVEEKIPRHRSLIPAKNAKYTLFDQHPLYIAYEELYCATFNDPFVLVLETLFISDKLRGTGQLFEVRTDGRKMIPVVSIDTPGINGDPVVTRIRLAGRLKSLDANKVAMDFRTENCRKVFLENLENALDNFNERNKNL